MQEKAIQLVSIIPYKIFPAQLGGEKGIALFNEYLAKKIRLVSVTIRSNGPAFANGYQLINTISDSRLRYINIFLFFQLRSLLKAKKTTHLIIEHPYFGWLAWMLRCSLNIKWIVHSHNIEYMRSRSIGRWWWKGLKWYEGWVYRNADKVFFISEEDRQFAIKWLKADPSKSIEVTYGIVQAGLPEDSLSSRAQICLKHAFPVTEKILLFNGALYHSTNYDALRVILDKINPVLLAQKNFKYKILVCGKGLPDSFDNLSGYIDKNIVYAGFVEDISVYFSAADVFINPILSGGGVKTKAIEALAMNCTVVSTELGAMGIQKQVCGNKLYVVPEGEWNTFADLIVLSSESNDFTPREFYQYYYWGNIIDKAVKNLD